MSFAGAASASAAPSVSAAASEQVASADRAWSRGSSHRLRATLADQGEWLPVPQGSKDHRQWRWRPADGGAPLAAERSGERLQTPDAAGIWYLEGSDDGARWTRVGPALITRVQHLWDSPRLNGYRMGKHPGIGREGEYAPPVQFIEVTEKNRDFAVSEHFRLSNFLTKDQRDVWPKYVPLDLKLVDKLELVISALREKGFHARGLHVMSGFRTPAYNGPGTGGRAKFSRHTYGDAADVWVDDDGDGQMDDLNRDGQINRADAAWLAELVSEVEKEYPELIGGAGIYKANRSHGPFTHIDVRGRRARW